MSIAESPSSRFEQILEELRQELDRAEMKNARGENLRAERQAIRAKKAEIEALDREIAKELAAVEKKFKNGRFSKEIRDRHYTFSRHYQDNIGELKANLEEIEGKNAEGTALTKAKNHIERITSRKKSKHPDQKLPVRTLKPKPRAPRLKKEEFQSPDESRASSQWLAVAFNQTTSVRQKRILLADNSPASDAAPSFASTLSFMKTVAVASPMILAQAAPTLPEAADLAETIEVQFTPQIKDLSAQLGHDPVRIYNWVRNTIEFIPTYGSIRGAGQCLQTKQCNAYDTASLLIALLRNSNISSRYVYGTVAIPADKFMNWAGGFTDVNAAIRFLSAAGIPIQPVLDGSVITGVRMEHVWVDAWIDYFPSRGARHRTGTVWIPLDPSFKQYSYGPGIDIKSRVPLDSETFLGQVQASTTANEPESFAAGGNCSTTSTFLENYQRAAAQYLKTSHPDASFGDVLGKKKIVKQEFPYLLGTLPYKVIVTGEKLSEMPDSLRHKFDIALNNGTEEIRVSKSFPELAGRKLTLGYVPATQTDQEVINSYLPAPHNDGSPVAFSELPASLPAYLISVKPELRIDGAIVATGPAMGLGQEETLSFDFTMPNLGTEKVTKTIEAGEFYAAAIDTGRGEQTLDALSVKLQATAAELASADITGLSKEDILGDVLHTAASSYFLELDSLNTVRSRSMGVMSLRLPSVFLGSADAAVSRIFGAPYTIGISGLAAEAPRRLDVVQALDNSEAKAKQYAFISGLESSALIRSAAGHLFRTAQTPASGVGAVSVMVAAREQGTPIYTINQSNVASVLPRLQIDGAASSEIQNAVNAAMVVIAPGTNINAFIVIDPNTGDAAPLLAPGINGSIIQGIDWAQKSIVLSLSKTLDPELKDLAVHIISSDLLSNIKQINTGVSDIALTMAANNTGLVTSGYFSQELASQLGCYLDPGLSGLPAGPCMANGLAGLCIANSINIISSSAARPVANAGSDQIVNVGDMVKLDGSGSSDPENSPLNYSWTILSKPEKSRATIYNADQA